MDEKRNVEFERLIEAARAVLRAEEEPDKTVLNTAEFFRREADRIDAKRIALNQLREALEAIGKE